MLTAIQGTYDHGQIILDEVPVVQKRTKVIVTFLEEEKETKKKPRTVESLTNTGVQFGSLVGKISIPTDFNEPLDDIKEYM